MKVLALVRATKSCPSARLDDLICNTDFPWNDKLVVSVPAVYISSLGRASCLWVSISQNPGVNLVLGLELLISNTESDVP